MTYRMLVLDLDGTVLDGQGGLGDADIAAAKALIAAGVKVTIATGRLFTGTQWIARALGITGNVAVMNGSEIIDVETERVNHGRYVDPEKRQLVGDVFADAGLSSLFVYGSRTIHVGAHDAHFAPYLATWTRDVQIHDDLGASAPWLADTDIVAVGTRGDPDRIRSAREALGRSVPRPHDSVTFQTGDGAMFLKLRHAEEDKGTALARLADEHGLVPEDCVAVGDWLNDLPMLRRAGLGLALARSDPRVHDAADEVLQTQRHAGGAVVEVAQRVWGITA